MSFDIVGGRPGGSGPYSCRLEHITPLPDLRSRDERSPLLPAGKLPVGGPFLGVTQPCCSCASPSGRSCERAHAASRIATCYRPTTESHTPRPRRPGPRNTACWVWRAPKHGLLGSLVPPFPSPPDHEDRIAGSAPCDQFEPTRRSVHSTSGPHGHVHRFRGRWGACYSASMRSSSAGVNDVSWTTRGVKPPSQKAIDPSSERPLERDPGNCVRGGEAGPRGPGPGGPARIECSSDDQQ